MVVMIRREDDQPRGAMRALKYGALILLAVVAITVTALALKDSGPLLQMPSVSLPEWMPKIGG